MGRTRGRRERKDEREQKVRAPIVNATAHWSDVGEAMLKKFPEAPFVGAWYEDAERVKRWRAKNRERYNETMRAYRKRKKEQK